MSDDDVNLKHLAKAIAAAYSKGEYVILELSYLLKKARGQFASDRLFGKWIKENDLDKINRVKRSYLIRLATMVEQGKATEEQILGMKLRDPRAIVTACEHAHAGFMLLKHAEKVPHTGGPKIRVQTRAEQEDEVDEDDDPPLKEGEGELDLPDIPEDVTTLAVILQDLRGLAERRTPEALWAEVIPEMNAEIREHMLFLIGWFERFGQIIENDPKAYVWK